MRYCGAKTEGGSARSATGRVACAAPYAAQSTRPAMASSERALSPTAATPRPPSQSSAQHKAGPDTPQRAGPPNLSARSTSCTSPPTHTDTARCAPARPPRPRPRSHRRRRARRRDQPAGVELELDVLGALGGRQEAQHRAAAGTAGDLEPARGRAPRERRRRDRGAEGARGLGAQAVVVLVGGAVLGDVRVLDDQRRRSAEGDQRELLGDRQAPRRAQRRPCGPRALARRVGHREPDVSVCARSAAPSAAGDWRAAAAIASVA